MYEHLPLYSFNVKIWIFFGFIRCGNRRRAFWFTIAPALMTLFQLLKIVVMWRCLEEQILGLFMAAIMFNSVARIAAVMRNESKFVRFLKEIEQWHLDVERSNDEFSSIILKKIARRTRLITKLSVLLGGFGGILTCLVPFSQADRKLPYDVFVPGLDVHKSPLYELIFAVQVINVMPFIMCTYVIFTNLFLTWLLFGIGILKSLRHRLESIKGKDECTMLRELKKCIVYHNRIIKFRSDLEDLVSFVSLVEFMLLSLMLCVLLFFILMVDDWLLQFTAGIYISCIFYVIFLSYWHANEFACESLKIADAVYRVDWIHGGKELRKCVLIMIARSQNVLQISAGGLYPMNLETFQALLNASYTYFTLLKSLMAK